jgi:hypothetical protein
MFQRVRLEAPPPPSRKEMAPQAIEKMESATGNGARNERRLSGVRRRPVGRSKRRSGRLVPSSWASALSSFKARFSLTISAEGEDRDLGQPVRARCAGGGIRPRDPGALPRWPAPQGLPRRPLPSEHWSQGGARIRCFRLLPCARERRGRALSPKSVRALCN